MFAYIIQLETLCWCVLVWLFCFHSCISLGVVFYCYANLCINPPNINCHFLWCWYAYSTVPLFLHDHQPAINRATVGLNYTYPDARAHTHTLKISPDKIRYRRRVHPPAQQKKICKKYTQQPRLINARFASMFYRCWITGRPCGWWCTRSPAFRTNTKNKEWTPKTFIKHYHTWNHIVTLHTQTHTHTHSQHTPTRADEHSITFIKFRICAAKSRALGYQNPRVRRPSRPRGVHSANKFARIFLKAYKQGNFGLFCNTN